jgi:hypothetical protein
MIVEWRKKEVMMHRARQEYFISIIKSKNCREYKVDNVEASFHVTVGQDHRHCYSIGFACTTVESSIFPHKIFDKEMLSCRTLSPAMEKKVEKRFPFDLIASENKIKINGNICS